MIDPAAARAVIASEPSRMTVTVPARRSPIVILILSIWSVGWVAAAVSSVVSKDYPFGSSGFGIAAFACFWTVPLAGILFLLHRVFSGREVIAVDGVAVVIAPLLAPFSRPRTFDASRIRELRATPLSSDLLHVIFWPGMCSFGLSGGHIAFDYGAKTYRIGAGVDEAEAKQIVRRILERYPALGQREPT